MFFRKNDDRNMPSANGSFGQGHMDDDPANFATGSFSSSSSRNSCSPTETSSEVSPPFNGFQAVKKASKASESVFKSQEVLKPSAWFDDKDKKATNKLLAQISSLHLNDEMSDVIFVVEEQPFPAHKLILAARCKYFKAMFTIRLSESKQKQIELLDISAAAFSLLLSYFYNGTMDLKANSCDLNIELLDLAHKYELLELQDLVAVHLENSLSIENFYSILPAAMLYSMKELVDHCVNFCQNKILLVLESKWFPTCPFQVLQEVLKRVNWSSSESQLAVSMISWIQANPEHAEGVRALMREKAALELMEINDEIHLFKRLHVVGGTLSEHLTDKGVKNAS